MAQYSAFNCHPAEFSSPIWRLVCTFCESAADFRHFCSVYCTYRIFRSVEAGGSVLLPYGSDCAGVSHRIQHFSLTLVWNLYLLSTLIAIVIQLLEQENERRTELQILAVKNKLAMESYENLRYQTEEVQMLRHDMMKHYSLSSPSTSHMNHFQ